MQRRRQPRKNKKVPRNLQRYVKKQIGKAHETQVFNVSSVENSIASTTAVTITELTRVPVNANSLGREGLEIRAFGLHLNYILLSSGVTVTIPQYVRVMVILAEEDQFDGVGDLFLANSSNNDPKAYTASLITDIINPVNRTQLNVLYDRTHKLEGQAEGMGSSSVKVKKYIRINHNRSFDSLSTGDSRKNNLRLLVINREIDNDSNLVTCEFSIFSRYYFKDGH